MLQDGRLLNYPAEYDAMTVAKLKAEGTPAVSKRLRRRTRAELLIMRSTICKRWAASHGCKAKAFALTSSPLVICPEQHQSAHLHYLMQAVWCRMDRCKVRISCSSQVKGSKTAPWPLEDRGASSRSLRPHGGLHWGRFLLCQLWKP